MLSAQAAISKTRGTLPQPGTEMVTERGQGPATRTRQIRTTAPQRAAASDRRGTHGARTRQTALYESATILFADMKDLRSPRAPCRRGTLVGELNRIFLYFDPGLRPPPDRKLKTIGDAYMCVGGLPEVSVTHPVDACLAALEFQGFMKRMAETRAREGRTFWEMRVASTPALSWLA